MTLMDAEEPTKRFHLGKRTAKILAAVGIVAAIGASAATKNYIGHRNAENFRRDIAMHLALPAFSGDNFSRQIVGPDASFELYDYDKREIYFRSAKNPSDVLPELSEHPEYAKILTERQKIDVLGGFYIGNVFSFPVADFRVDKNNLVKTNFGNVEYDVSLGELSDFLSDGSVCGGYGEVSTGEYAGRRPVRFVNHQFYTAKRGEPSLARLAGKLVEGADTNERKAQVLLNFVTRKIKYDGSYALSGGQKIKRADEVLLTKESDCSGKSVLYASLLEQTGIDYYMMYFFPERGDGHITVAVEGNFPDHNGLAFDVNGKKYYVAETTIDGFRIGETRVADDKYYHSGKRYVQTSCSNQGYFHRFLRGFTSNSDIVDLDTSVPLKLVY